MRPAYYAEQWRILKSAPDRAGLESLAQRIASTFLDRYYYSDEYNSGYVQILCEMATQFGQAEWNQIASGALFGIVIERLCDDFEELQTETYNRLICQVVDHLRKLPEGGALDVALREFNLATEAQLYQRIESIRLNPDESVDHELRPRKIVILSRVTIGADVAITSVICQRALQKYPDAAIVVAGNPKLWQVFSGESRIEVLPLQYARRGGLLERFTAWLELLETVRAQIEGLHETEYLVLDPDSRLTQLGVLPLVPDGNYRFFNSRGKAGYPDRASISELTNLWLDNLFGKAGFCFPSVWPDTRACRLAAAAHEGFAAAGVRKTVTLNFGVGGNDRKRVGVEFERKLVATLLREPGTLVILDLGFGEEERARSEAILDTAQEGGIQVQRVDFPTLPDVDPGARLIGVECSVAEVAAIIAQSHEFIGYDSACQHIAAAQGIRTFTIFAGTNNVRFIRRWHACGTNLSEIVYVDTISRDRTIDPDEIVRRLMDLRRD